LTELLQLRDSEVRALQKRCNALSDKKAKEASRLVQENEKLHQDLLLASLRSSIVEHGGGNVQDGETKVETKDGACAESMQQHLLAKLQHEQDAHKDDNDLKNALIAGLQKELKDTQDRRSQLHDEYVVTAIEKSANIAISGEDLGGDVLAAFEDETTVVVVEPQPKPVPSTTTVAPKVLRSAIKAYPSGIPPYYISNGVHPKTPVRRGTTRIQTPRPSLLHLALCQASATEPSRLSSMTALLDDLLADQDDTILDGEATSQAAACAL
jgi:hypothetical protein